MIVFPSDLVLANEHTYCSMGATDEHTY